MPSCWLLLFLPVHGNLSLFPGDAIATLAETLILLGRVIALGKPPLNNLDLNVERLVRRVR